MSALDNQPDNINFLSNLGFRFQIKKAPHVNFFVQRVNLPAISLEATEQPNPFVRIPQWGDHIIYSDLEVTFKVDEDLKNYLEIHNWIKGLGFPDDYSEYEDLARQPKTSQAGIEADISLLILSSSKNPTHEVVFRDAAPIALSSLLFDSTTSEVQYLTATAVFRYTSYSIESLST